MSFQSSTVKQLKELIKQRGIKGYSKLKKQELLESDDASDASSASTRDVSPQTQRPRRAALARPVKPNRGKSKYILKSSLSRRSSTTRNPYVSPPRTTNRAIQDDGSSDNPNASWKVTELKDLCKQRGIKGYSKFRKQELLTSNTQPQPRAHLSPATGAIPRRTVKVQSKTKPKTKPKRGQSPSRARSRSNSMQYSPSRGLPKRAQLSATKVAGELKSILKKPIYTSDEDEDEDEDDIAEPRRRPISQSPRKQIKAIHRSQLKVQPPNQ